MHHYRPLSAFLFLSCLALVLLCSACKKQSCGTCTTTTILKGAPVYCYLDDTTRTYKQVCDAEFDKLNHTHTSGETHCHSSNISVDSYTECRKD